MAYAFAQSSEWDLLRINFMIEIWAKLDVSDTDLAHYFPNVSTGSLEVSVSHRKLLEQILKRTNQFSSLVRQNGTQECWRIWYSQLKLPQKDD